MVGKEKTPKVAEKKEVQKKKNDDSSSSKASRSEKSAPPQPKKVSSKVIPKKVAEKSGSEKKEEKNEGVPLQNKKRERMEVDQTSSKKSRKEEKQLSEDVDVHEKQEQETKWRLVVGVDSPVTEAEIREFFIKSGCNISKVNVVKFKEDREKWGVIFVFATTEDAEKVLALNGREFKGKPITVEFSTKLPLTEACKTVVVKGVTTGSDIRELFHDFEDDITEIRPYYRRLTKQRILFHFVNFNTHASVLKALELHCTMFKGVSAYVDYDMREKKAV